MGSVGRAPVQPVPHGFLAARVSTRVESSPPPGIETETGEERHSNVRGRYTVNPSWYLQRPSANGLGRSGASRDSHRSLPCPRCSREHPTTTPS